MQRLCVSGLSRYVWQPSMPVSFMHDFSMLCGSTLLELTGRSHLQATSTQGRRPLEQASADESAREAEWNADGKRSSSAGSTI